MIETPSSPATPSPALPGDSDGAWVDRQLEALGELMDISLRVARRIESQMTDDSFNAAETANALARVARAMRLTVLLQSKLLSDRKAQAASRTLHAEFAEARAKDKCKARVKRIVARVSWGKDKDEGALNRLVAEASERLDHDEVYGDLLGRPLSEIVARICEDLGLEPDWTRLAVEHWAQAEISSGAAGWPLSPLPHRGGREPMNAFAGDSS